MAMEEQMSKLQATVGRCKRCGLHQTKVHVVFGEGSANAEVMFVGEAPGYWEDRMGRPFVGAAGKLLEELLAMIGLGRGMVYITNVVKCRPPMNRQPRKTDVETCTRYLEKQVEIVKPRVVCTLGNVATAYMLEKFGLKPHSMKEAHGKVFQVKKGPIRLDLIPLYHPATALYNPGMRHVMEKDWLSLKGKLGEGAAKA